MNIGSVKTVLSRTRSRTKLDNVYLAAAGYLNTVCTLTTAVYSYTVSSISSYLRINWKSRSELTDLSVYEISVIASLSYSFYCVVGIDNLYNTFRNRVTV